MSTNRNLQYMVSSRLAFSYRWNRNRVTALRIEVSSNGFVGCTATNYGNCRVVDRFEFNDPAHLEVRDAAYRTALFDVSDFDGKPNVQVRFVVETAGGPVDGDFDVFDPVFVGWYTGT